MDTRRLKSRTFAHPFDHAQPSPDETRGHGASPDAIGGYYGCQWQQVYRDLLTGECYRVNCYDGTNRSKGPFKNEVEEWMLRQHETIIARTHAQAKSGAAQIFLSREEWAIMSSRIFSGWFDPLLPCDQYGRTVGDANRYALEGMVGTINGVSVIVDPKLPNPLGEPPSDVWARHEREDKAVDAFKTLAEMMEY